MALIDLFLCQTATVKPFVRMGDGEPVYGAEETRKCRLERGRKLEVVAAKADGSIDQTLANAKMFCRGQPIPERSVVSHNGREYIVIACHVKNGFSDNHLEVYLE